VVIEEADGESDFGGCTVPNGIVEGFFHGEEEVVADFAGDDMVGKGVRDLDMTGDIDLGEEFFDVAGKVAGD
jgi:hypothetical protein